MMLLPKQIFAFYYVIKPVDEYCSDNNIHPGKIVASQGTFHSSNPNELIFVYDPFIDDFYKVDQANILFTVTIKPKQ